MKYLEMKISLFERYSIIPKELNMLYYTKEAYVKVCADEFEEEFFMKIKTHFMDINGAIRAFSYRTIKY